MYLFQVANTIILSASRRKFTRVPCADRKAQSFQIDLMKSVCPKFHVICSTRLCKGDTPIAFV